MSRARGSVLCLCAGIHLILSQSYTIGMVIIHILRREKLRLSEVKYNNIVQSHLLVRGQTRTRARSHSAPQPLLSASAVCGFSFNLRLPPAVGCVCCVHCPALAPGTVPALLWLLNNAEEWRKLNPASSR